MSQASVYRDYSLVDRIVKCENELRKLKTAQIYGNTQVVGVESNTLVLQANVKVSPITTGRNYYEYWWGGIFRFFSEGHVTPIARLKLASETSSSVNPNGKESISGVIDVGEGYCDFYFFADITDWSSNTQGTATFYVTAVSNGKGILQTSRVGTLSDFPDWVG